MADSEEGGDFTGKKITTYDSMNKKIVELLEMRGMAIDMYAAQRIRELESMLNLSVPKSIKEG